MPLIKRVSFSGGEVDQALDVRDNLEKVQTGLAIARNVHIGKTGRVVSRSGLPFVIEGKLAGRNFRIESSKDSKYLVEWGHQYVRIHDTEAETYSDDAHDWTEDDLDDLNFTFNGRYCYIFKKSSNFKKMVIGDLDISDPLLDSRFLSNSEILQFPSAPGNGSEVSASTGTGYDVEYLITQVNEKFEESLGKLITAVTGTGKLPINSGEVNTVRTPVGPTGVLEAVNGIRVYRRPKNGGAFGLVGTSEKQVTSGPTTYVVFTDNGEDADYTVQPPDYTGYFYLQQTAISTDKDIVASYLRPKTGIVYQQRLILGNLEFTDEAAIASRTSYQGNFLRDFPLGEDSALSFKSASSGDAKIFSFFDAGRLLAFTSNGVYANDPGALVPENSYLLKKADFVISETVPPLAIPGGILFIDASTNTVRSLQYSQEGDSFEGHEVSVFSDHLFRNKSIKSWCFQKGYIPLVHVIFDDGTIAYFTYQKEHEMQAWTRGDTDGIFHDCTVVKNETTKRDDVYYVVERNGKYLIEKTSDRLQSDQKDLILMDSAVTKKLKLADDLGIGDETFYLEPVTEDDWDGDLYLTSTEVNSFEMADEGEIFRFFDHLDARVDLLVTSFIDDQTVIVKPNRTIPEEVRENFVELYYTYVNVDGLDHLEGQSVSVISDGRVFGSPKNDLQNYEVFIVENGEISLSENQRGSIIHVGLPFVVDIANLKLNEKDAVIVNSVEIKTFESRGFYISQNLPDDDSVIGMSEPVCREDSDPAYAALPLKTKTYEISIPSDWYAKGQVCIRQVDPVPLELLMMRPDLTVSQ